jgi:hypothetical protein
MAMEVNPQSKAYRNNFQLVIPVFRFQYTCVSPGKLESYPKVNYIIHYIHVLFVPNNIRPKKHNLSMWGSDINDLLPRKNVIFCK